jgi:superfamily II DNA or RNA helicase
MELAEHLTYYADNYKFSPKYRAKMWDGKIRLLNRMTGLVYAGLAQRIKKFCDSRDYTITFDEELYYENVSEHELTEFLNGLNLPDWLEVREYQYNSILKCVRSNRRLLKSPTSSGKSFMIYAITEWYKKKTLVIVPTTGLVDQMSDDFISYGFGGVISRSTDGLDKSNDIDADVVITTWQSLNNGKTKMPKAWYKQFQVVFGDEAHGAKANCLRQIMESLEHCRYRFGTTGTLDGNSLNEATIIGLFGPIYTATTTKELMDDKHVTPLKIKCIVLNYDQDICKDAKGLKYHDEVNFLIKMKERNRFIKNLGLSLDNNKLIFFRILEHGRQLRDLIEPHAEQLFYIEGGVDPKIRNEIRKAMENEHNAFLVASLGTTSTGVSINKLKHMIAAHPSKSTIKVLQSIGRLLRLHPEIDTVYLYDIVDNLTYNGRKNYLLKHFEHRVEIYDQEQFEYEIYNVRIKKDSK